MWYIATGHLTRLHRQARDKRHNQGGFSVLEWAVIGLVVLTLATALGVAITSAVNARKNKIK